MERELTYAAVYHPEMIDGEWALVDHPTVRPLQNGDATLGWEGDTRLAVYLHLPSKTFMIWRLENDTTYRPVARLEPGAEITPASMCSAIRNLIRIDQRRGFVPLDEVEKVMALKAKHAETDRKDALDEFADKLHFGLAHSYLPGVDIVRPRQVLSRS